MKTICKPILTSVLLAFSLPAAAQYDAGATQMLGQGMGFSALSSSTYRNSIEATKGKNGAKSSAPRRAGESRRQKADVKPGAKAARSGEPVLRNQADVDRFMNERMQYHARALAPEYKRRAARDGQAAADKWIRARGEALGKMEGDRARKLVVQD
ncbi:MAG: hypothetical protein WC590_07775 [Burkholderiaceae bacterium]